MHLLRIFLCTLAFALLGLHPYPAGAAPTAATFTAGECLATAPTGRTVDCGSVTLPLHADRPAGTQITLPIMIIRSTVSNANPPLYLLQGGPGGDTIDTFVSILNKPEAIIPSDRDIILVEQRGTTSTTPSLNCPEITAITAELYATQVSPAERTNREMNAWQACADRLRAAGIELSAFNSIANADDIAAVAAMLGHDQIDVYGVSYGSLLAQHLVVRHPTLVHALVLDGVVPPSLNPQTQWMMSRQTSFANLFADCDADLACGAQYPDLATRLPALLARIKANPLTLQVTDIAQTTTHTVVFGDEEVAGVLFQMMYDDELATFVPMLIDQIEHNNLAAFESIAGLFLFYDGMSEGMQATTNCAEENPATLADYAVPSNGLFPLTSDIVADDIAYTERWCAIAAVERLPAEVNAAVTSDVPVLISSGRYDPITPANFAKYIAPGFRTATVIVTPNGAHGAILGNVCSAGIFRAFLDNPMQAPNTDCLSTQKTVFASATTITQSTAVAQILNGTNPFGQGLYATLFGFLWMFVGLIVRPFAYLIRRVRNSTVPTPAVRLFHVFQYGVSLGAVVTFGHLGWILYESALVQNSAAFLFGIPRTSAYYDVVIWSFPALVAVYSVLWIRLVAARTQNIAGFVYALSVASAAVCILYTYATMGIYTWAR
ncbi:MAG: hypothetical protein RLY87_2180 [Chloroflexota bacterium]